MADNLHGFAGELDSIRFATILFADIVGSTRLLRALDPEDARDLIDASIKLIQNAIHDFQGLVVRVQGDGVMAVFGIHPAAQDHALRAALAARQIVDRMKGGSIGILPSLQVRIGIHAGPILLRRQDHDFGSIVDVVGHAAHVAGQVEQLASPGSVAISATTASLIAENCDLRQTGRLPSDGHDSADDGGEAVFELAAINFAGSDHVPVKGNATYPVIGRDKDLEQVRAMIAALPAGKPAAIGFIGDAGMGKSRLLLEASRLAAGYGVTFVVIRGNPLMAAVPFGCLSPAVRHVVELLRPFCADPAQAAGLPAEQAECLNGFAGGIGAWLPGLSPGDRSRIATQAIVGLLRLAVENMPLLLLVDDMHYIDRETRSILTGIRQSAALGIIAAGRPEATLRLTTLCGKPSQLKALPSDAARTLISLINRAAPLEDGTIEKILARADGLPLALQEFAVTAQSDQGTVRLPARLENLLAERLAALDEDASRLCQLCSALGPSFQASHLAKGAALVCRNPAAATIRLVESRVIETAQADVVRFTHQLVQEAAYATMTRRRRKTMHLRVLELLEGDAATHAELATHAEKAGLPERALDHQWNASIEALGLAAISSVLALYRRARDIAAWLDPPASQFQRARFALLALDTLQQLSLEQEVRQDIEAVANGQIDMGPGIRTVARINMALLDWIDGSPVRGTEWLAQAQADLDNHDSLPRRTFADVVGAYIAFSRARPEEAVARIELLGARLQDGLDGATFGAVVVIPHILARAFGAWYLVDLDDLPRARRWIAESARLSRRYHHDYSRLLSHLAHGYLHYRGGHIPKALGIMRRALAECLNRRFFGFEPVCVGWTALCLIDAGLLDEAEVILNASLERGSYLKVRTAGTYYLHEARARLAMARGNAAQATAIAAQALNHCRDCGEIMHELHARVLCAEVRAAFAQPVGDLSDLQARVTELGIAPLLKRLNALTKDAR
ncbi:adenylate/guanylate cyclase domain-containing protein [Novosphingobium sp. AAP83]|uniref:ATP-binding protein n=1 Tax=Novosphingobium sp. AAP83 TaxID=1523425 RepID=UPI0018D01A38|nr:adenylate/guanylate cyclase domain-containing protein [Novosphingobium sp. AAP83]